MYELLCGSSLKVRKIRMCLQNSVIFLKKDESIASYLQKVNTQRCIQNQPCR